MASTVAIVLGTKTFNLLILLESPLCGIAPEKYVIPLCPLQLLFLSEACPPFPAQPQLDILPCPRLAPKSKQCSADFPSLLWGGDGSEEWLSWLRGGMPDSVDLKGLKYVQERGIGDTMSVLPGTACLSCYPWRLRSKECVPLFGLESALFLPSV